MRKLLPLMIALLLAAGSTTTVLAQDATDNPTPAGWQHGFRFIDLDGDGINDNAPDADGDGIPNGMDPDYVRPMDGSGSQRGFRGRGNAWNGGMGHGAGFVDEDGDGVCDNFNSGLGRGMGQWGRDGLHGRNFVDANGDGVCDRLGTGSGPQGRGFNRSGGGH